MGIRTILDDLGGTLTKNINHPRRQKEKDLGADGLQPSKVELLNTEVLANRHFRYEQFTLRMETFAGILSQPFKREVLRIGRAVAVLLYDPAAHRLIMIEQFRVGAYLNHLPSPWIVELVAGMVDEGETSEAAARREAKEETGCDVGKMEPIGAYLSTPGISDELVSIYVGEVDAARAGGIHGHVAEGEDIRTIKFTVDEALAAADNGAVANVMAQVALLWFARNGDALRRRWLGSAIED
jgi:ADP-ribose pyrophosphatase